MTKQGRCESPLSQSVSVPYCLSQYWKRRKLFWQMFVLQIKHAPWHYNNYQYFAMVVKTHQSFPFSSPFCLSLYFIFLFFLRNIETSKLVIYFSQKCCVCVWYLYHTCMECNFLFIGHLRHSLLMAPQANTACRSSIWSRTKHKTGAFTLHFLTVSRMSGIQALPV